MADENAVQKVEPSVAVKFTEAVMREFSGSVGSPIVLTEYQQKLSQHLFVKIDATLNTLEAKRLASNKPGSPIAWANMNMSKLAVDVMHRIELGLDALIPNHISPIPYFNTRLKMYDLDLRVGYTGKDYYRRNMAMDPPVDIIYELVYTNDTFKPLKRTAGSSVESYKFDIPNPFDRGEVEGGFAYIKYTDPSKNKLVLVTEKDFKKSESLGNKTFWGNHPIKMRFKTLVNRATDELDIDPRKANAAFVAVEKDDAADRMVVETEISELANKGPVLKITGEGAAEVPKETTELPTDKHPAYDLCIEQRGCEKYERVSECPNAESGPMRLKCVHGLVLDKKKSEPATVTVPCPNDAGNMKTLAICEECPDFKGCPEREN